MIRTVLKKIVPIPIKRKLRWLAPKLTAPFYYGDKMYCNVCDHWFRKFKTTGIIPRENALCPYCESRERTRVLHYYLKNETNIFHQPIKLLHFAPESGLFDLFVKLDIEYIDADLNPNHARHVIDMTDIPYDNEYFDMIICAHVLGHIPDENLAIEELYRVLKNGGEAIIMSLIDSKAEKTKEDKSDNTPQQRLEAYGEPDLLRLYGKDFKGKLESFGFDVEVIDYRDQVDEAIAKHNNFGDGSRELIYKCTKSKKT